MTCKTMISALAALVICLSITAIPAQANVQNLETASISTQYRSRRFGPYATIRRANEVANIYRRRGYNAKVIYGGTLDSRVYYVDVW